MYIGELLSNEAIVFQSNSDITTTLVGMVDEVLSSGELGQLYAVGTWIKRRTGMSFKVTVFEEEGSAPSHNVSVDIPNLNTLSPLSKDKYTATKLKTALSKGYETVNDLTGRIDPKAVKVTGFYSDIVFTLNLNSNLFNGSFTAREITAIIAHEMGHAWDYLESLGEEVTANHILSETLRIFEEEKTVEKKFELVKAVADDTTVLQEDMNLIGQEELIALVEVSREQRNLIRTKGKAMSVQMDELAGDMFASRLGLGGDLVSAMTKIIKNSKWFSRPTGYGGKWRGALSWGIEIALLPFAAKRFISKGAMSLLSYLARERVINLAIDLGVTAVTGSVADMQLRFKNIIHDSRGLLRDPKVPDSDKVLILRDIRQMEENINSIEKTPITPRKLIDSFILNKVSPHQRDLLRADNMASLSNNRLYELAYKLKQGKV